MRGQKQDLGTQVFGKIPPQDVQLEKTVLGIMLLEIDAVSIGMAKLFSDVFYTDAHQKIFNCFGQLYDKHYPIDLRTVHTQLKVNGWLEEVGGIVYLSRLTDGVVSSANIESHIMILLECYLKRKSIELGGSLVVDAYDDSTDAFDIINKADAGFQNIQERVLGGLEKNIAYFGMKVIEQHDIVQQSGVLGIPTGLVAIDQIMGGMVEPDLIVLAARPGQGKTALALSITHNVSVVNNVPGAWFSLEMDGVQLTRRLASINSCVPHEIIRKGRTTAHERKMFHLAVEKISNSPIYIEDKPGITIRDVRTRLHLLKKKYGIKYAVIDYLQLMRGIDEKGKNREAIISDISRGLKEVAKELKIPIIALSQLSREVEKRVDKMPQLSDLRESGAIEQDADEVIFLMRPAYYDMQESIIIEGVEYSPNGLVIVIVAKNRHGDTKNTALQFVGALMEFRDHPENTHVGREKPKQEAATYEGLTSDQPF